MLKIHLINNAEYKYEFVGLFYKENIISTMTKQ